MSARKSGSSRSAPRPIPAKVEWERDQLSVRLTATRRERLQRVASLMPLGATPGAAIDRAIELALAAALDPTGPSAASRDAIGARLDEFEERFERSERQQATSAGALLSRAEATLCEVRALARLIADAAAPQEDEGIGLEAPTPPTPLLPARADASEPMSLRAWLEAQPPRDGPLSVEARWLSTSRLTGSLSAMDFELGHRAGAPTTPVRVAPVASDSALHLAQSRGEVALSARPASGGGWSLIIVAPNVKGGRDFLGQARV
jgi:hypothetical protein